MMDFDTFISYSSKDKPTADATCAVLESSGIRCWIAPRDIRAGGEYGAAIIDAIDQCRVMVLIFSSSSNGSQQIHREIERAVSKGIPIVPVRIEETVPTKSMAYFLGAIHWLDAFTPPLEKHLQKLAETVKAILQVDAKASVSLDDNKMSQSSPKAMAKSRIDGKPLDSDFVSPLAASRTWILNAVAGLLGLFVLGVGLFYYLVVSQPKQWLQSGEYDIVAAGFIGKCEIIVRGSAITGLSTWNCCPGQRTDAINGTITGDKITFTRDCSGQGASGPCDQVFTGNLGDNTASGTFTMNGKLAGSWTMNKRP